MVSSIVVDSTVLKMTIQFEYIFLIRRIYGDCNVRNFRRFLFGMCPDEPSFKVRLLLASDLKF